MAGAAIALAALVTVAQPPPRRPPSGFGFGSGRGPRPSPRTSSPARCPTTAASSSRGCATPSRPPKDVRRTASSGGEAARREPPWSHDYPRAERNFMKILDQVTTVDPYTGPAGGIIVDIGSPDLFKYPVQPTWRRRASGRRPTRRRRTSAPTCRRAASSSSTISAANDWSNFEAQVKRVLPDARIVELELSHPVFHAFFDIESLDFVQFYGRDQQAYFLGVFEDNDPQKRLLLRRELQQRHRGVLGVLGHRAGRRSTCRTRRTSSA